MKAGKLLLVLVGTWKLEHINLEIEYQLFILTKSNYFLSRGKERKV